MVIALILLSLLFIATLFNFPTKKFMATLQSFFTKPTTQNAPNTTKASPKKVIKIGGAAATQNRNELKSVFATFDKNKDGFVTKQEIKESLDNIGIYMTEREVAEMVEKVDSNGDGLVDLDEFCDLYGLVVGGEGSSGAGGEEEQGEGGGEEDLKQAFDVFDGDGDGLISVEELSMVLASLGLKEGNRVESCKEMIRKVDADGDGMVNFEEFKRMMKDGGRLVPVS